MSSWLWWAFAISPVSLNRQSSPSKDSCEKHAIWKSGMPPSLSIDSKGHEVQNQLHQVDFSFGDEKKHYHVIHFRHHICVTISR